MRKIRGGHGHGDQGHGDDGDGPGCDREPGVLHAFHGTGVLAFDPTWTRHAITLPLLSGQGVTNAIVASFDDHDVTTLEDCL